MNNLNNKKKIIVVKKNKQVYNFKFTNELIHKMRKFSFDNLQQNRKTIKQNWGNWCNSNTIMIQKELLLLKNNGYNGTMDTILQKMFHSVRYYYMKHPKAILSIKNEFNTKQVKFQIEGNILLPNNSIIKKERKNKNRNFDKEFITCIKQHIQNYYDTNGKVKPQLSYDNFVELNNELYNEQHDLYLQTYNNSTTKEFIKSLKKTYKNQYYRLIK